MRNKGESGGDAAYVRTSIAALYSPYNSACCDAPRPSHIALTRLISASIAPMQTGEEPLSRASTDTCDVSRILTAATIAFSPTDDRVLWGESVNARYLEHRRARVSRISVMVRDNAIWTQRYYDLGQTNICELPLRATSH